MVKTKWIFVIIVVVIIILLLSINIFKHEKKYNHYLVLGDSIAEGYGLKDKNNRYAKLVQKNYKIKNENFVDLSKSGMTAHELSLNLNNSEYINGIKNSDLITISIGSNELLSVFTQIVEQVVLSSSTADLNVLSNSLTKELQSTSSRKLFEESISVYKQSWDSILEQIKAINPNATIVATEFYNPYYNLEELGGISEYYIKQLNDILHDKNNTAYYIANIYEVFNNPEEKCTNVNTDSLNYNRFNISSFDPHPNAHGHKIIAEKIIESLQK